MASAVFVFENKCAKTGKVKRTENFTAEDTENSLIKKKFDSCNSWRNLIPSPGGHFPPLCALKNFTNGEKK
jgi:hypothetical protein